MIFLSVLQQDLVVPLDFLRMHSRPEISRPINVLLMATPSLPGIWASTVAIEQWVGTSVGRLESLGGLKINLLMLQFNLSDGFISIFSATPSARYEMRASNQLVEVEVVNIFRESTTENESSIFNAIDQAIKSNPSDFTEYIRKY